MSTGQTKECPFCAETIKAAARLCRFCGCSLPLPDPSAVPAPAPAPSAGFPSPAVGLRRSELFDMLTALVEKSLVVYEEDAQGGGRYRLLETVRQYARDRLLESQEGAAVRNRHLQLFLQLAEEAESQSYSSREVEWLDCLETEHDNLRAALDWSAASDPELGLRLASALGWFWFLHVHRREGVQWLEQLLALPPGAPTIARARALDATGLLAVIIGGTPDQARQRWEESLALSRQLGYDLGIASALKRLAHYEEDHQQRLALGEESLALTRATGDLPALLDALIWLMHLIDRRRDRERLRALVEEVMEIAQGLGSCFGIAMAYRFQGGLAWDEGDLPTARRCLGEELARIVPLKDWAGVYGTLLGLAGLAARQGDYLRTGRMLGLREWLGDTTGLGDPADRAAARVRLATESGAPSEAAFAAACAEGRAMSLQQAVDYALGLEEECS